jgi:hypothetical protein
MTAKRFSEEQIIGVLKEAEAGARLSKRRRSMIRSTTSERSAAGLLSARR